MMAKEIERAAYIAAHRILDTNTAAPELACPGARRSRAVDMIADIIREVFELHSVNNSEWFEREVGSGLRIVNGRRGGASPRLPSRAYPNEVA